ncbi:MAG: hypothetical protein NWS71_02840 [Opitutales bacterium]|jgi:predicted DNA binding CopG/RHH family protein|nr:hypothetical protein [Opitutales bacterium]MDP4693520.1 hypothetical protein [Opitutales bacterium]MDP4883695.1 hypothetical protein [Opitutales bacterium]
MKVDDYEKELIELDKAGAIVGKPATESELSQLQSSARATLNKDKRINIRISSRDLNQLQLRANRYGLPYQTLISSILHRYVSGEIEDQVFEEKAKYNKK